MGGMVAIAAAAAAPDHVVSLALVGTAMHPSADVRAPRWAGRTLRAALRDPLRRLFPADSGAPRQVDYSVFERVDDYHLPRMAADYRSLSGEVANAIIDTLETVDLTGEARGLRLPTLIVHGCRDAVFPPATAERTAAAIAGSALMLLPNDNHVSLVLLSDSALYGALSEHFAAAEAP